MFSEICAAERCNGVEIVVGGKMRNGFAGCSIALGARCAVECTTRNSERLNGIREVLLVQPAVEFAVFGVPDALDCTAITSIDWKLFGGCLWRVKDGSKG
jgi:hypothetical protein